MAARKKRTDKDKSKPSTYPPKKSLSLKPFAVKVTAKSKNKLNKKESGRKARNPRRSEKRGAFLFARRR